MSSILITGAAGFIGYHVSKVLCEAGHHVVGVDSLNNYYSTRLKYGRLAELGIRFEEGKQRTFTSDSLPFIFYHENLANASAIRSIFNRHEISVVINLAAQAGVRYSLEFPEKYVEANIVGFFNVLQSAKEKNVKHFVYASSSSVYGLNKKMPLAVTDNVDHPISLYAASKKSNELFAHSYSHLYKIPTTGLRFFTVYGPWGRPDMAYYKFTKAISQGKSIEVYNEGDMYRDFTYIDDIVAGIVKVVDCPPTGDTDWDGMQPNPSSSPAPYQVLNIGNHTPVKLIDFIRLLESELGIDADIIFKPMQPGDVYKTFADVSKLESLTGYAPSTPLRDGLNKFVKWYRQWHN